MTPVNWESRAGDLDPGIYSTSKAIQFCWGNLGEKYNEVFLPPKLQQIFDVFKKTLISLPSKCPKYYSKYLCFSGTLYLFESNFMHSWVLVCFNSKFLRVGVVLKEALLWIFNHCTFNMKSAITYKHYYPIPSLIFALNWGRCASKHLSTWPGFSLGDWKSATYEHWMFFKYSFSYI